MSVMVCPSPMSCGDVRRRTELLQDPRPLDAVVVGWGVLVRFLHVVESVLQGVLRVACLRSRRRDPLVVQRVVHRVQRVCLPAARLPARVVPRASSTCRRGGTSPLFAVS